MHVGANIRSSAPIRVVLAAAASLIAEADAIGEATGSGYAPYAAMMLASFRGDQAEAAPLIQASIENAVARGQGFAVTWAHWATAILDNGLGRYTEALAEARQASDHAHLYVSTWTLPELIEAAARTGNTRVASDALELLAGWTRPSRTELGTGIEARSRALLSDGETAEEHYREAIGRLSRTPRRPDLARAHLLYGEWLRRERRRGEAREQLRTAARCWTRWAWKALPSGPAASCWLPVTPGHAPHQRRRHVGQPPPPVLAVADSHQHQMGRASARSQPARLGVRHCRIRCGGGIRASRPDDHQSERARLARGEGDRLGGSP